MCSSSIPTGANPQEVNLSAVRSFYLLKWLIHSPNGLTLTEINERFTQCPDVGKAFSDDTIGLYLNTLRALGCTISRPSKRNRHRYQLTHHPFSSFHLPIESELKPQTTETYTAAPIIQGLAEAKRTLLTQLPYTEILALDDLVTQLLCETTPGHSKNHAVHEYFRQSRSVDYRPQSGLINQINTHLNGPTKPKPLVLTYQSPSPRTTPTQIRMIPSHLTYAQGALYLCGTNPTGEERRKEFRLRIDRITTCQSEDHHADIKARTTEQQPPQNIHLRLYPSQNETASPVAIGIPSPWQDWLGMMQHQGTLQNIHVSPATPSITERAYVNILATYTDEFILLQQLYQTPHTLTVVSPNHLAARYTTELQRMLERYTA